MAASLITTERLLELTANLPNQSVVILADLVADRFLYGTPRRVSREAPVLILEHESEQLIPGGGANAAANVAALGGRAHLVGRLGTDGAGDQLLEALKARGVLGGGASGICRTDALLTPTKTRILGGAPNTLKQQIVRYDTGAFTPPEAPELERLSEALKQTVAASSASVGLMSDYHYGCVEPKLLPGFRNALGKSSTLLLDSRYRLSNFSGFDGATPNLEEAEALLGARLERDDDLAAAGPRLLEQLGSRFLLITLGSRGMALFEREKNSAISRHRIQAAGGNQVTDVTGAGDTVIGTLALALAAGATTLEAVLLANYAGGVVVMKPGTATLDPTELRSAVQAHPEVLETLETATGEAQGA